MPEIKYSAAEREGASWLRAGIVIALISVVLLTLWFLPALAFNVGVAVVAVLAAREFYLLDTSDGCDPLYRRLGLLGVGLLPLQMMAFPAVSGLAVPALVMCIFSAAVLNTRSPNRAEFYDLLQVMFGLVYVGGIFGQLVLIRNAPAGRELTTVLVLTVLAREVGANLGGALFPSRKALNESINPSKSYHGSAVGIGAAVGAAVLASQHLRINLPVFRAVVLGTCVGVACQFGDLSESYMKRVAGRRHSGKALGPQGGFLDFVDAAAFAIVTTRVLLFLWDY